MRWLSRGCLIFAVSALVLWRITLACAADPTMFDEGRAQRAFAAIQDKVGHKLRVLTLTIGADELRVEIPNTDKPGEVETWEVSHKGLLGALGADAPVRQRSLRAQIINGTLDENLIDIDADGLAMVPKLAAAALDRARFQQPGQVTEMELHRVPNILTGGVLDPGWLVHVEGIEEEADIYAKITGEITIADLNRTKRVKNLNLFAGGPDFDELVKSIRSEIEDKWTFHYIEIGKKQIDFDVTLNSVKNPRMTRFAATLSEIKTYNTSIPHMVFPGDPTDDPFTLDDVDLSLLTKLEDAAKDRLGIADGIVERVIVSKPHRERGGAVEWEVQVISASAPVFAMPGAPKPPEGSVTFDTKGNVLRTKYPEGRGPQTNLFDAATLAKAIDKIGERLGAHVQLTELLVADTSINITAQDPQDPKKLVVFVYKDEDVSRASDAFQTVANASGAGADWLWDLALLQPAVLQSIPALEKQTMARLNITTGEIVRITISKDKMFHPTNDKVLIEIRASGNGKDSEWVTFDLAGTVPKLAAPVSGIRVVGPQGNVTASTTTNPSATTAQDDDDCTRSQDPDKVIPACTKLAEDRTDTPHNRAVAYYDRGNAYKNLKDYDRALADYSDALKLDPRYAHAYLNRGFVYAAKNDADHAIADLSRSIQLDPAEPMAYFNRGLVYRVGKHNDDASIADFTEVIKRNPDAGNAYYERGLAFAEKGDYQRALADYDQAAKRTSDDAKLLLARGIAHRSLNRFEPAIADFDAAIKIDSGYAAAYEARGFAYRLQGDLDRAIGDYGEAIRIDPKLVLAYNDRGSTYRLKGDFDHAIADYTEAIQLDPNSAIGYYRRGYVQYLAGALPKALADLTQANAIDPANAYLAVLLDIVNQRSNLPSRLRQLAANVDMRAWPAPVIRLYLGQLTPDALLAAADDSDPQTRRGKICEANFYTGELALIRGKKDDAARLFTAASSDCPLSWSEWESADAELKTLGVTPPPQAKR
jgi:tetratricopeptide (TPR) repeat protein